MQLEEVGGGDSDGGDGCVWPNNDGGSNGGMVEGPGEGSHGRSSGRDPIGASDEGRVTTGSKDNPLYHPRRDVQPLTKSHCKEAAQNQNYLLARAQRCAQLFWKPMGKIHSQSESKT
jgi:hypothetical protein